MSKKIDPLRPVDEEAVVLTRQLLTDARYAALGVIGEEAGYPLVSRVAVCWSLDAGLYFAASDLSLHSRSLVHDPRCSVMLGEPGKGDGLAYPRITFVGETGRMANNDNARNGLRDIFLNIHPKAALYIDFADFGFYQVEVSHAFLNGGFGKAYRFGKEEIMSVLRS